MKYLILFIVMASSTISFSDELQKPADKSAASPMSIEREKVRQVIRSNLMPIKKCYEDEVKKDPNLEGKVNIQFTITDAGKVKTAKIKTTQMNSQVVEECILTVIKGLNFPEAPKGTEAEVTYPFLFQKNK